jgi:hypothetical protein
VRVKFRCDEISLEGWTTFIFNDELLFDVITPANLPDVEYDGSFSGHVPASEELDWEELGEEQRTASAVLGVADQETWANTAPRVEGVEWSALTEAERNALTALGWSTDLHGSYRAARMRAAGLSPTAGSSSALTPASPKRKAGKARTKERNAAALKRKEAAAEAAAGGGGGAAAVGDGGGDGTGDSAGDGGELKPEAAPLPELEWFQCARGADLADDNHTVKVSGTTKACGAVGNLEFSSGTFSFRVVVGEDRKCAIGVAAASAQIKTDTIGSSSSCWVWSLGDNQIWADGAKVKSDVVPHIPEAGSQITCIVDVTAGTIGFEMTSESADGSPTSSAAPTPPVTVHSLPSIITGITTKHLRPFVALSGNSVISGLTLVSHTPTSPPRALQQPVFKNWGPQQLLYEPGNKEYFSPCYIDDSEWSEDTEAAYLYIGRFVGLAMLNNVRIELKLSRHVIKYLLRKKIGWHDLAFFSIQRYERYRKTIAMPADWIVPGISVFTVDFGLNEYQTLELVPGGADIDVTEENVLDFVERAAKALLVTSTERALMMMRAGFEEVFPPGSLSSALSAEDFQVILNGSPEIQTSVLKSHCKFSGGHGSQEFQDLFWEYVDTLDTKEKSRLLGFWTGSSCVPSDLASWVIKIEVSGDLARLPNATTCYFKMTVPPYDSLEMFQQRFGIAIQETTYQHA